MSTWLIAGTPVTEPYPCRCGLVRGDCGRRRCSCHGRTDVIGLPSTCCMFRDADPDVAFLVTWAEAQAAR